MLQQHASYILPQLGLERKTGVVSAFQRPYNPLHVTRYKFYRSVSPRKEEAQAGAGRGPDVRSHTPPRGSLAQRHSCERGERSKQHTSVKNALSPASRRNKASRSPSPRNGGGSKRHSEDSSPRNKKTGALRRDAAVSRSRSPEKARKTAAEEFHKQGHRGSSERREGPVGAEPSGKPTGRSGHAPLMSSVGGSSKQEHQHRNGRRGHERKTRREDADSRNGPTAHTHRDHEDYGRYGGGGTPHTKEERSTGRPRRDRDERSNRDELPARHGHGTDHHPSSRSRHEVNRRPPSGKFPDDQTIQGASCCACARYHSLSFSGSMLTPVALDT